MAPTPDIRKLARSEFSGHVVTVQDSKAFRFSRATGGSFYSYILTWMPGTVTITGDLGSLTLSHPQAMAGWRDAMEWLAGSDYDYLMQKASPRDQELDHAGTAKFILDMADESALRSLKYTLNQRREFRAAAQEAITEWEIALLEWETSDQAGDKPTIDDFRPDGARYDLDMHCAMVASTEVDYLIRRGYRHRGLDHKDIPDGFELWYRIWAVFQDDLDLPDPDIIFLAHGRKRLRQELVSFIGESSTATIHELCESLNFSDYSGSYRYTDQSIWQIEAIQHAARMLIDNPPSQLRTWLLRWHSAMTLLRHAIAPRRSNKAQVAETPRGTDA